ncbi:hypothetical protein [Neomoorella thermoacetica]|uniref:hypothetical protein n=1 Tax=Neomoorella thermoacetica TaxID=1525 RepID=UPI0015D66263|nr:hypothetical protein [Moorella thermoacetica]
MTTLISYSLVQTLGVGETIDYLLGEEHLSVQQMQDELARPGSVPAPLVKYNRRN